MMISFIVLSSLLVLFSRLFVFVLPSLSLPKIFKLLFVTNSMQVSHFSSASLFQGESGQSHECFDLKKPPDAKEVYNCNHLTPDNLWPTDVVRRQKWDHF